MGADLYIQSLYRPHRERWEPQFDAAVKRRDSLPADSPEFAEAQKQVDDCFEQMLSQGYFRDPYNNWDLLWQFGMSWWTDVIPMLDDDGRLSVAGAKKLLAMMTEREEVFARAAVRLQQKGRATLPRSLRRVAAVPQPGCCPWRANRLLIVGPGAKRGVAAQRRTAPLSFLLA